MIITREKQLKYYHLYKNLIKYICFYKNNRLYQFIISFIFLPFLHKIIQVSINFIMYHISSTFILIQDIIYFLFLKFAKIKIYCVGIWIEKQNVKDPDYSEMQRRLLEFLLNMII